MEYEIALRHHTHGEGANKIMRRTYMIKTDGQMTCNKKDSITKLGIGMTVTEWRWREAYCYTRNRTTMGRYSVGERQMTITFHAGTQDLLILSWNMMSIDSNSHGR